MVTDNTEPAEDDDFAFVRTINGNYLPLTRLYGVYNTRPTMGWEAAASLVPSEIIPFEMASTGETGITSVASTHDECYGIMFGSGGLTPTEAFDAYNVQTPISCENMRTGATADNFKPINAIYYDAETDKYSQQMKWNLYNLGSTDFTFSEVGIFCDVTGWTSRSHVSMIWKNGSTWQTTGSAPNLKIPAMIAYEAFDETITLHSGDVLQIIITQGAAGLDWTIRTNGNDAPQPDLIGEPKSSQTVTPTQEEITEETTPITDTTAKAVVALAETYIGQAGYTQNLTGHPNRQGDVYNGKTWYDCSSFCFDMWRRNGVTLSDSWTAGSNMPNTEALGKYALSHGLVVSKSQIQAGDIILTARRNSDGSWKYPDKWNHVNHAKLYVGELERDGKPYNVIEMVGTDHDAIRSYYNLNDATFVCQFIIHPN
ncbi:MAG: C40 family peptidase [Paludibacteraceae bacterium]|nr:C40 family peptidase [Paludibacteraceae bacterium]